MAYEITEIKKIGIGLIGFGLFFTFLGIILFFDRGLLALGNIFSLAGVGILLGWRSTWALFTNRANFKALFSPSLFITKFISFCNETLSPANVLFEWMPGSASFLLVDFGHLSKCSSTISLLLDGLYSLSLVCRVFEGPTPVQLNDKLRFPRLLDCHRRDLTDSLLVYG
ncbi:Vesicle transport protein GOT1 [Glycine soja]